MSIRNSTAILALTLAPAWSPPAGASPPDVPSGCGDHFLPALQAVVTRDPDALRGVAGRLTARVDCIEESIAREALYTVGGADPHTLDQPVLAAFLDATGVSGDHDVLSSTHATAVAEHLHLGAHALVVAAGRDGTPRDLAATRVARARTLVAAARFVIEGADRADPSEASLGPLHDRGLALEGALDPASGPLTTRIAAAQQVFIGSAAKELLPLNETLYSLGERREGLQHLVDLCGPSASGASLAAAQGHAACADALSHAAVDLVERAGAADRDIIAVHLAAVDHARAAWTAMGSPRAAHPTVTLLTGTRRRAAALAAAPGLVEQDHMRLFEHLLASSLEPAPIGNVAWVHGYLLASPLVFDRDANRHLASNNLSRLCEDAFAELQQRHQAGVTKAEGEVVDVCAREIRGVEPGLAARLRQIREGHGEVDEPASSPATAPVPQRPFDAEPYMRGLNMIAWGLAHIEEELPVDRAVGVDVNFVEALIRGPLHDFAGLTGVGSERHRSAIRQGSDACWLPGPRGACTDKVAGEQLGAIADLLGSWGRAGEAEILAAHARHLGGTSTGAASQAADVHTYAVRVQLQDPSSEQIPVARLSHPSTLKLRSRGADPEIEALLAASNARVTGASPVDALLRGAPGDLGMTWYLPAGEYELPTAWKQRPTCRFEVRDHGARLRVVEAPTGGWFCQVTEFGG